MHALRIATWVTAILLSIALLACAPQTGPGTPQPTTTPAEVGIAQTSTPTPSPTATPEPTPTPTLEPTPTPEPTLPLPAKWEFFPNPETGSWVMRMWEVTPETIIYAPVSGIAWVSYTGHDIGAPLEDYAYICIEEEDGSGICLYPGKLGVDVQLHSPVIYDHGKVGSVEVAYGDPLLTVLGGGPSYVVPYWQSLGYEPTFFQIMVVWHDAEKNIIVDQSTVALLFESSSS